ncbi:MAG: hypothetical protein J7L95_05400, partial [Prolixibacteraceae bacterium]|nr:hypothetical protein [Prolixibacteraceae bacterium]
MQKYLLLLLILTGMLRAEAQRAKGSWQDYLSFANATKVAATENRIYCVTTGGLFYYNLSDNSINKFSGLNGLSDFGIKTIAYSPENKVLIVAYNNSNIDLVYESEVINLSDIKRKQITGDKGINNITFIGNEAYLACGFGIVVLTLDRKEIKDTYFIGEDGSSLRVNDVKTMGEFLYAATDEGILRAELNGQNLLDFKNWIKIENIPHSDEKFSHLVVHAGKLIANYTPDLYNEDRLYALTDGQWSDYLPQINYATDIQVQDGYMVVTSRSEIFVIDSNDAVLGMVNFYQFGENKISPINPRSAAVGTDGVLWVADFESGLVRMSGDNFEKILPNGPMDNRMFCLKANGRDLWVAPGGRSDSWNNTWQPAHFQLYRNGQWNYFSKDKTPELNGFFDVVAIAADPADPDHIFVGSWGGGVLEFKGGTFAARYTNLNSPLETALPQQPNEPYVRIGGLNFDSQGNLWVTNSEVADNLLKRSPDGKWESFTLPEVANIWNIGQVIVTQNDDKWILVPRGHDAYVVNKSGTQKKRLLVTSYFNNGENEIFNRMNDLYSIAEDNEGAIWIGTSKGVAVYGSPQRIWDSDNFYATQPSLDLNDGLYHPLLETETVTAIA